MLPSGRPLGGREGGRCLVSLLSLPILTPSSSSSYHQALPWDLELEDMRSVRDFAHSYCQQQQQEVRKEAAGRAGWGLLVPPFVVTLCSPPSLRSDSPLLSCCQGGGVHGGGLHVLVHGAGPRFSRRDVVLATGGNPALVEKTVGGRC